MTFREKLTRLCEAKGWTQAELSRRIAVDPSTVARWNKGARPGLDAVSVRLAKALGVSLDYLADDELDEPGPATFPVRPVDPKDELVLEVMRDLGLKPHEAIRRLNGRDGDGK